MTKSNKQSDEQQPSQTTWPDAAEGIEFIDHLIEAGDQSDDNSEWEKLKTILNQDRLSRRKLFLK